MWGFIWLGGNWAWDLQVGVLFFFFEGFGVGNGFLFLEAGMVTEIWEGV